MQGDKIYTTYDVSEIFPAMRLKFLITTSKVFKIGLSELKGELLWLLSLYHRCRLLESILALDPSTASNMDKAMESMWELGKYAGKKNVKRYLILRKTRLISNLTIQSQSKSDSPPEDDVCIQGKARGTGTVY